MTQKMWTGMTMNMWAAMTQLVWAEMTVARKWSGRSSLHALTPSTPSLSDLEIRRASGFLAGYGERVVAGYVHYRVLRPRYHLIAGFEQQDVQRV